MAPDEALEHVRAVTTNNPAIKIVGIAGPGEPLANAQTFETFALVQRNFPEFLLCLSTNGLLLPDTCESLLRLRVATITISINAVDAVIAGQIYAGLHFQGATLESEAAANVLIQQQLRGLRQAVRSGIRVKVNSIYLPGINDGHLETVAMTVAEAGAELMNIVPLIPAGAFCHLPRPEHAALRQIRQRCARHITQFHLCRQCRADAVGIPGFG
jgi:nitrogen fixation protein NifB